MNNPAREYFCSELWNGEENLTQYSNRVATKNGLYDAYTEMFVDKFSDFFASHDNHEFCDLQYNPVTVNFYFEREIDFTSFSKEFSHEIVEVTCPNPNTDLNALDTQYDVTRSFRNKPFFGSFEWKILFEKDCDGDSLDDWVDQMFLGDTSRFHYDASNKQRSLYLTSECDVTLAKISHTNSIYEIEQII